MKLIYIANQRMPTEKGYGIQISKMCEAFADFGLSVTLLVPFRRNLIRETIFKYYDIRNNFEVKTIWTPDFYLPGKLDMIAFFAKSILSALVLSSYAILNKSSIIYSRDELTAYILSFFKKHVYLEIHKYLGKRKLFYSRFKNKRLKIIVISKGLKDVFVKNGFSSENILIAPDGVDLNEFDVNISQDEARRKTNLDANRKIILYTGHLFDWKGVDTLAMAAKILPEYLFIFIGGTDSDVCKFRDKYGDFDNILILGHKPHREIPVYLKTADVLVLPNSSRNELSSNYTSPLKLFEYMAAQKPIVASDLPSIREILNENSAYLVQPDNPKALAEEIAKALNNKNYAETIAANAFAKIHELTWDSRARQIINFTTK